MHLNIFKLVYFRIHTHESHNSTRLKLLHIVEFMCSILQPCSTSYCNSRTTEEHNTSTPSSALPHCHTSTYWTKKISFHKSLEIS